MPAPPRSRQAPPEASWIGALERRSPASWSVDTSTRSCSIRIGSIPAGEDVSLYREGAFEDLCRGPHVPSTGKLKAFKLTKVAGASQQGFAVFPQ